MFWFGKHKDKTAPGTGRGAGKNLQAAIYTRELRNEKGKISDPAEKQRERCEKYARDLGCEVALVLNEGEHGPADERTGLRELRAELWKRNVNVVIAARPETLYVDTDRFVKLVKEIGALGAYIEFVDVNVDDYIFDMRIED